jgi:serine phosphatase RsbU (regulator of sigma subunit)
MTTARRDPGQAARTARVLDSVPVGLCAVDGDGRVTSANAEARRLLGRLEGDPVGAVLWELFPVVAASAVRECCHLAAMTGQPSTVDVRLPPPGGEWFEVRVGPSADGLAVCVLDVTTRLREHEVADRATWRADLLSRVTEEMAGALSAEDASAQLCRLVAPALADWCIVTLSSDDAHAGSRHGLGGTVAWHTDPTQSGLADAYARHRLAALVDDSLFVRAMETGQAEHLVSGATPSVVAMLGPGPVSDLVTALAPESAFVVPLPGREGAVGLLTLCNGADRGPFSVQDLTIAREVAARAGLVLDNARLYRQQARLAAGLQRALLTDPPEPDRLQVVVRYAPAAEAAQVGGDWYDAFFQADGATVLVIGDVVGHDAVAAAAMGQLRALVRGFAALGRDGPEAVLSKVDRVMATLQVDATATAVVGRLEESAADRARGRVRLQWSNAGHPPPMVVHPDGSVQVLDAGDPDVLLGVLPEVQRRQETVVLDRGATLVLYTDGLVERRGQSLDTGLALLREALHDLRGRDLDHLCDELLARLLPADATDDVAILAVRLHGTGEG